MTYAKVIKATDARGEFTGYVVRCECGYKFDGPGMVGLEWYSDAAIARNAHNTYEHPVHEHTPLSRRGCPACFPYAFVS